MVDVEADGPAPGRYSMVSFGAVVVRGGLEDTFYGKTKSISDEYIPEALAISGVSREEHLLFEHPRPVMLRFKQWITEVSIGQPMFVSDNNGFDWQWINYYFCNYKIDNPFGYSSTNLGSLYKGLILDSRRNFKHLRKTKHSHHPVDDAIGNAEAMLHMRDQMRYKVSFI